MQLKGMEYIPHLFQDRHLVVDNFNNPEFVAVLCSNYKACGSSTLARMDV